MKASECCREGQRNFGCCAAAAACMQGLLLACLLAQQEAGLGAMGERRLKPLAAARSSGRSKISDNSTLEMTVTSVLKLGYFCLHFPAKGKVDFSRGGTWCLAQTL